MSTPGQGPIHEHRWALSQSTTIGSIISIVVDISLASIPKATTPNGPVAFRHNL